MIMKNLITLFACFFSFSLVAQMDTIYFDNPSFDGKPYRADGYSKNSLPVGIYDCGNGPSIPDIFPPLYEKNLIPEAPDHGKTYLGMVVRENNTRESVSQKLSKAILAGNCYTFSVSLAYSDDYLNQGDMQHGAQYNLSATLKIYGGEDYCDKIELLWSSPSKIENSWQRHTIEFLAGEDFTHITFEADYILPDFKANGNILVDNLSPIIEIECN